MGEIKLIKVWQFFMDKCNNFRQ